MNDPYRHQSRTRIGIMIIVGLAVILVIAGVVSVMRDRTTPEEAQRERAVEAQLDQAEARSDAARLKLEERRRAAFE